MTHGDSLVAHQFEDIEQQRSSAVLGMWLFLITEIMFFGGLFTAYLVYRLMYPAAFHEGVQELSIPLGAVNTLILQMSSLTMAWAVAGAQRANRRALTFHLLLTIILGLAFLGIKAFEYHHKYVHHLVPGPLFQFEGSAPRETEMFFMLYFCLTGVHALHMIIGIVIMAVLAGLALRGSFLGPRYLPIELFGYYWHFVDIVWVFLFPLLYVMDKLPHV